MASLAKVARTEKLAGMYSGFMCREFVLYEEVNYNRDDDTPH